MVDKNRNHPANISTDDGLDLDLGSGTGNLVPIEQPMSADKQLEQYAATSRQIAKMHEPNIFATDELDNKKIIHPDLVDEKITNIYRELRTKLLQKSNSGNCIIMVTGAVPSSGTSHITINMASSFAFDATKTSLLIDCNLTKPSLHKLFEVEPEFGLTDFLESDDAQLEKVIIPTGMRRLRLVPAGQRRESSTEYFTSFKIRLFLDAVKKRYPDRFIFLDSPPIGQSADAQILAQLCDYIILVVPYGRITEARLNKIVNTIDSSKMLGVIFNG